MRTAEANIKNAPETRKLTYSLSFVTIFANKVARSENKSERTVILFSFRTPMHPSILKTPIADRKVNSTANTGVSENGKP